MKIQKQIAHKRHTRGVTCILLIAMLFVTLFMYTVLPDTQSVQNTRRMQNESIASLFAHANTNNDIIFTVSFVGDIMLGRSLQDASEDYGYDYYFEKTNEYFTGFDLVLGNFENAIEYAGKESNAAKKNFLLSANVDCLTAVVNAGFNMLNVANNHMLDYGVTGMLNTIDFLNQAGIAHVGAGRDVYEASSYQTIENDEIKIAVVGINEVTVSDSASRTTPGVLGARTLEPFHLKAVTDAASVVDVVIVYIHWGDEYTTVISNNQREIGKNLIDAGADIVIGSHPHTLQPIEMYKDGIIFYSLGNFIFDQGWSRTKDSCIVRYCIDENGHGVFELIPLRINNGCPAETSNPIFTKRIFHALTKNLSSENYVLDDGRLYVYPPTIKLN
ncbi:MAG: CapA family protein [Nitrososphaerota archaeon]|nr:CapA family protein [Nitrososphaerota archaeon]